MRASGMNQDIFGSDKVVSDIILQLAGESADGIVAAYPFNPYSQNPNLDRFVGNYKERFGKDAEVYAIQAYD